MKKFALGLGVLLLAVVAYLAFWPVPIRAVSWKAPAAPGYVGPHAVNQKLAGLKLIDLGGEEGPEHVVLARDGKLYTTVLSGNILRMNPDGSGREVFAHTGGRVLGCYRLAPKRGGMFKPMRVLICGIPNVGKSTLINTLKGKRAAKTGDEAGVTRTEARIVLADDFYLYDTPGMLWPRIIVPESGYNLAASGAVGKNAYDEEEVAYELIAKLKADYPALMEARYALGLTPEAWAQTHDDELLEAIGRKRGALAGGGRVNIQKAAELVIADFRALHIGRITLETPEQFARWLKAGKQADAERAARKKKLREEGHISPERKPAKKTAPRKPR